MALLRAARTAQSPLVAEFTFNFNDTMVDVAGATKTFGFVQADQGTFEVIPLPPGAIITGGEVIVEVQGVGPTLYTINVGNTGSATAFASAVDLKGAVGTRTALTGLGFNAVANAGGNVRIAIVSTVAAASAGKARVRVEYTVDRRATDTQIA
jgi:hypothetical protein